MYDKRVVRGSVQRGGSEAASGRQRRSGGGELQRSREWEGRAFGGDVPPVAGRAHSEIQTETYLEVLSDKPPEEEVGVQSDAALNRPPVPLFVPAPVRAFFPPFAKV